MSLSSTEPYRFEDFVIFYVHLTIFTSRQFNKIYEKTYSEEKHLVNSRYELLTTRQQLCGDISTLFQSHFHRKTVVVLLLTAHILSLQDVVLRSMFFSYIMCICMSSLIKSPSFR